MADTLADIQRKYGESVYPLYKDQMHEPYMELENGKGYKGVILYDELIDKISCSLCGSWMKNLTAHVSNYHGVSPQKYREDNGLPKIVPLCSVGYSLKLSKISSARKHIRKGFGVKKGHKWSSITNEKRRLSLIKGKNTTWFKNKYGLCDAQVAARLIVVAKMSQKETMIDLTTTDLITYDYKLYIFLKEKWGTVKNACLNLGIKYGRESKFDDAQAISDLRSFVTKNKRIPRVEEMRRDRGYFSKNTFLIHFGSWRRAKMMAGLDQLLEEVKGA